jgi:hypothetical protein
VVNIIRSALNVSQVPHDDRWQDRYDDVPRLVEGAIEKYGAKNSKPAPCAPRTKAQELKAMAFNPVQFLVVNLIPNEGVTLVCAKPKSGKSWLVLDLALASTMDRYTLGEIKPLQGSVLYLALEDSLRRLRSRIDRLLPSSVVEWPEHLLSPTATTRTPKHRCSTNLQQRKNRRAIVLAHPLDPRRAASWSCELVKPSREGCSARTAGRSPAFILA